MSAPVTSSKFIHLPPGTLPRRIRLRLQRQDFTVQQMIVVPRDQATADGFDLFEAAVSVAYRQLPYRFVYPDEDETVGENMAYVILTNQDGQECLVEDEHLRGEEWFKELIVEMVDLSATHHQPGDKP